MSDVENVISDLEEQITWIRDNDSHKFPGWGHAVLAMRAAIALLKAQEPRVMTLEEVLDMKFDDVVYLQVNPTNAVLSAIVIDVIPKLPEINVGVVQFRHGAGYNGINNADLSYYGKTWRCWTSRPDRETREATPWERLN